MIDFKIKAYLIINRGRIWTEDSDAQDFLNWAPDLAEAYIKMREALEWYANKRNWEAWEEDGQPTEYQNHDGGARARKALEE